MIVLFCFVLLCFVQVLHSHAWNFGPIHLQEHVRRAGVSLPQAHPARSGKGSKHFTTAVDGQLYVVTRLLWTLHLLGSQESSCSAKELPMWHGVSEVASTLVVLRCRTERLPVSERRLLGALQQQYRQSRDTCEGDGLLVEWVLSCQGASSSKGASPGDHASCEDTNNK